MKIHETQPKKQVDSERLSINPILEDAQRIEGGGPPKKASLNAMPKWLRIFWFFILGVMGIGVVLLVFSAIVR
ncbi:MAG TPA: hypothetical protein VEZ13_14795 [Brevibacillus sp.]|nr:hypothetical protein [Brevibacillus sp.]